RRPESDQVPLGAAHGQHVAPVAVAPGRPLAGRKMRELGVPQPCKIVQDRPLHPFAVEGEVAVRRVFERRLGIRERIADVVDGVVEECREMPIIECLRGLVAEEVGARLRDVPGHLGQRVLTLLIAQSGPRDPELRTGDAVGPPVASRATVRQGMLGLVVHVRCPHVLVMRDRDHRLPLHLPEECAQPPKPLSAASARLRSAVCLAALGMLLLAPAATGDSSAASLRLVAGVPAVRPLTSGAADLVQIELVAGRHWLVSVEQDGLDVVVEVKDPRGRSVLAVDSPLGREGTEWLLLAPEATGRYGVEVRCEKKGVPAGRYGIRLQELPAATPSDQLRLHAEAAVTDAGRLYGKGTAEARKEARARLGEALGDFQTLGDERRQAETSWTLGSLLQELDDFRQAAEHYQQGLALFRSLGDGPGTAATLDGLGTAHNSLGENPQALGYLQEALELRQRLGQP